MDSHTVRSVTSGASHFCGFHDLTPWNVHTSELVCLRTGTTEDHIPTHQDEADVVVIDDANKTEHVVGTTRAWNWQKAARQRWLPALGRRVVAYNAANERGFECRIVDLDTNQTRVLPVAVYDHCDHAGFGLTLNFRRLFQHQPGYGYDHPTPDRSFDPEGDGIFRVDLQTGEVRLILRMADFLQDQGIDPARGEHYFTHLQISPNGQKYVFMYRCFLKSGGLVNDFIVAQSDGSGYKVLLDDKMSHFDWQDDEHVVVWCRKNAAIKRLKESKFLALARVLFRISRKIRIKAVRQGLYNESFRTIDVNTGSSSVFGKGVLTEDGHPQINPCHSRLWVNDTYPNPDQIQTLMLYDRQQNKRYDLAALKTQASILETGWRCDFHPRWRHDGEVICVDSAHLGRRQLCLIDVSHTLHEMTL